ncbi:MAG: prepilin-type N-terminal cleavage/methylation domain-containing protein [Sedimentisphaerales bacterium]|nr:prepilin-type N-terminal cleavage/methylation domain-containing protein [Sedimentisphaerales bacterium]
MRTSKAGTWTRNRTGREAVSRGFTFIELIVVLVVLGVSASVVFPRLGDFLLKEPEPWQSARKLVRVARYAHEWAVTTESAVSLHIDTETGNYWAADRAMREGAGESPWGRDLRGRLADDVEITGLRWRGEDRVAADVLVVEFRPDGWNDPFVVKMTSSDAETVEVVFGDRLGEVELVGAEGGR